MIYPGALSPQGRGSSYRYLDTVNVGPTHAAAPVNEEDELPMGLSQVRLDRLEVRAEVEHDDRMVGNVLVEAFPDDFCLEEKGKLSHFGHSRGPELLLGAHAVPPFLTRLCQDPTHALHGTVPGCLHLALLCARLSQLHGLQRQKDRDLNPSSHHPAL